ncbi:MAG: hydantoinase/oxoprolinase [Pyrinomonadaceae bacterium]|nr:hydantoinase/oxoprolinase [Pyrinomonadaceae bacterium]
MSRNKLRRVRVGIDVGGTFTDAVVIDYETGEFIGQLKVPTTHHAPDGVARGIIDAIEQSLGRFGVAPSEVMFIAHSTTQATNALLEGDVARVGIIGMGSGLEAWKANHDTRVPPMRLAPGRMLRPHHGFIKTTNNLSDETIRRMVHDLCEQGAEVVVASEAFGVDHPANEDRVADIARRAGLMATCGHEVSSLYGLRTRTRTAVLNAAILPKMFATAEMTARCVEQARISAPLMIMRSDGGVMSVAEVHARPILTMLSGPAAGIAGALMHERVSDGIFIEVGGTSADISVIRDGGPQTRPARVGGHRTFLNTLDVRTLAIAGGSLIREGGGQILDVGPRSAHIAGLGYACFAAASVFDKARLVHLRPTERDAEDYVAIQAGGEAGDEVGGETGSTARYALTPTCAANLLGIIPEDSFARGSREAARAAFRPLAEALGVNEEEAAKHVLEASCRKVAKQIEELIDEYKLERATVELIGGGGGCAALVPYTAQMLGLSHRIARQAEVISTIGVALAMVRDSVERNIVDPSPADILQVRREAAEAVTKAGALPETIETEVEVDTRRNLVRATAFGTTELRREEDQAGHTLDVDDCRSAAARSMQVELKCVRLAAETSSLHVFVATHYEQRMFGLFRSERQMLRVTDHTGVIRLQRSAAEVAASEVADIARDLERIITGLTDFGDAGRTLPDVHVLVGRRIINLSGLADAEQVIALAQAELEALPPDERLVIVAAPRSA